MINGKPIVGYNETGIEFADGTEVDADVIVFATGYVELATAHTSAHAIKDPLTCSQLREGYDLVCGECAWERHC